MGRLRTVSTVILALWCTSVWASAQTERRAPTPGQRPVAAGHVPQGPIDFRCDKLEIISKPQNRQICRGHVVLRRDDLLLCCTTLIGESDAQWSPQQIICTGDVRLQRANQTVWADAGRYDVALGEVVLTGAPMLERDGSQVFGEQMIVNLSTQQARVVRPRGQLAPALTQSVPQTPRKRSDVLPQQCPIGPRPTGLR